MSDRTGTLKGVSALVISAVLSAALPQAAGAQVVADEWLPWLGCWQPVDAPADAPITCVRPAGEGVELIAVTEAGVVAVRPLGPDGVARQSTLDECSGVERAWFSGDGTRVYLEAERTCPGDATRASRGLMAMLDHDRWIEAQAMEVRGRTVAWIQRYDLAPRARVHALGQGDLLALVDQRAPLIAAARAVAATPIGVDEIIEAHTFTDPEAVRVWLAEQIQPFYLDASGLRRLAAAGVSDEVIDVAVAVAYPDRFAVTRDEPYAPRARVPPRRPGVYPGVYPGYWDPYWGYWGRGYWGPYYRPTVVVVRPRDGRGSSVAAVRGQGYTRGTGGSSSGTGATARSPQRPGTSQPAATSGSGTRNPEPRRAQPRKRD
jgi:hypothetical protein